MGTVVVEYGTAMSSVTHIKTVRQSGQRRDGKHGGKSLLAPTLGVHTSDLGEHRLNIQQIYALEAMYQTHPAVQAARSVLHSQLLQGGIQLMRNGEVAKPVKFGETNSDGSRKSGITQDWARHLEEHWLPFAKEVIDCYIKWGICPVVLEELADDTEQINAIEKLKREVGMVEAKRKDVRKRDRPKLLVPHVPMLGTYDIAWAFTGRYGYTREYMLYNNAPGHVTRVDPTAFIHVRQHPDSVGNVNSPLATVYEQGSFVAGLVEMAFTAELARSQPAYVTQIRKQEKGTDLTAGGLWFDAESRQQQTGQETEESQMAARALELQAHLARTINAVQHQGHGTGAGPSRPSFAAPEIPPKLFTLPKVSALTLPFTLSTLQHRTLLTVLSPFAGPRARSARPGAAAAWRPRGAHAPGYRSILLGPGTCYALPYTSLYICSFSACVRSLPCHAAGQYSAPTWRHVASSMRIPFCKFSRPSMGLMFARDQQRRTSSTLLASYQQTAMACSTCQTAP